MTAVDYSEAAVEIGRVTLAEFADGEVRVADCKALPFPDAAFDRVYAGDVIEHQDFEDGVLMLREMYRVLRPGGFLFLHTAPNAVFMRFVLPLARPPLRRIDRAGMERFDEHMKVNALVHVHEYSLLSLRRARAGRASTPVWIGADAAFGAPSTHAESRAEPAGDLRRLARPPRAGPLPSWATTSSQGGEAGRLEQAREPGRGRPGAPRNDGARRLRASTGVAMRHVPVVGLAEHRDVAPNAAEAELFSRAADVGAHRAAVHQCVIGAERREPERARESHPEHRGHHRHGPHAAPGPGVRDERLECLAHRAELRRADVVDAEARPFCGADAGIREVVRVDELIDVVAAAEHGHVAAEADPLEEIW